MGITKESLEKIYKEVQKILRLRTNLKIGGKQNGK